MRISELERNNKAAMTAHVIEVAVMLIFCLLQVMSKQRNIVLFIFISILLYAAPRDPRRGAPRDARQRGSSRRPCLGK